jgi:hypothetical protein
MVAEKSAHADLYDFGARRWATRYRPTPALWSLAALHGIEGLDGWLIISSGKGPLWLQLRPPAEASAT